MNICMCVQFKCWFLTPDSGQWLLQGQMFHCAAVNVSQLWGELQSGRLSEGTVFVGVRNVDAGSFGHVHSVLRPVDLHRSRIETSHMTEEGVLLSELHVVFGVDHRTGRRIWTETQDMSSELLL